MQHYLMRNARVYHDLLFFTWQKSLVEKNDFIVTEGLGLYMMSGEGFYLCIQVLTMS